MRNLKKRDRVAVVVMILTFVLSAVGCVVLNHVIVGYRAEVATQEASIRDLENQLAVKRSAVTLKANEIVQDVTGLNMERKAKDDLIALEFVKRITTWTGYDEYELMRNAIFKEYKPDSGGHFASLFLAPYVTTTDESEEYSCRFSDLTTMVSSISADRYTYFSVVECVPTGPKGGNGAMQLVFMYTIDGDGKISDMDAYSMD